MMNLQNLKNGASLTITSEACELFERDPEILMVLDATVYKGCARVAPITYANGRVCPVVAESFVVDYDDIDHIY